MTDVTLEWIDNHCHLGDDAAEAIVAAQDVGVRKFIDVGCDLATSRACVGHASEFDSVSATVGLHPHEARHGIDGLEPLLANPDVIAVGECGLDFHYDHSPRQAQRDMFAAQIELAHTHELPLVIHTREAWQETFEILDNEGVPEHTIFHCFTGGPGRSAAVHRSRRMAFIQRHRVVQVCDRCSAGGDPVSDRQASCRDRLAVSGACSTPGQAEPASLGERRGAGGCCASRDDRHRHRGGNMAKHPPGVSRAGRGLDRIIATIFGAVVPKW